MQITLDWNHPSASDAAQNVIRDLDRSNVKSPESNGRAVLTRPRTRLVAPDGSIAKEWQDFIGPAEIGLAVRSVLGEPLYSQMESEALPAAHP